MRLVISLLILVGLCVPASADTGQCERAIRDYKNVSSDLADAVNRYVRCLNASDGTDDCSSEFSRLKWQQSEFEDAVSELKWRCR